MKRCHAIVLSGLLALAGAGRAFGQGVPDGVAPGGSLQERLSGQQVAQIFDFEERTVNFQKMPMYWSKTEPADGFPHFSEGMLDDSRARGGKFSFKVKPNGGSAGFEYDPRRIRVKPGGDSQVTGYASFSRGDRCRAQLRCVLTDRLGHPIAESERWSELAGPGNAGPDGWVEMTVYVPGNFPEARYIAVSVWFLQEEQWATSRSASHIYQKNVWAEVWFDDISIFQLPRVVLRTTRPDNLFGPGLTPQVEVEVQGVGTLDYQAHLSLRDSRRRILHSERWVLTGLEGEIKVRSFEFGSLAAGIYNAELDIYSSDLKIASRCIAFGTLAPLLGDADQGGQGFGVIALDPDSGPLETTTSLLQSLRARLLKLPVWRRNGQTDGVIALEPDFDAKLVRMLRDRIKVIAVFDEVTDAMAAQMITADGSVLDLFQQDARLWTGDLSLLLAQYARQIVYWQVGGDSNRVRLDSRVGRTIEVIRPEFRKLVGETTLIAPVTATQLVRPDQMQSEAVAVFVPRAVAPETIPGHVADYLGQGFKTVWLTLDWHDALKQEREFALIDLAKRLVYARRSGAEAIFLQRPWQRRMDSARAIVEPTEAYPVFRTIADLLGGSTFSDELYLGDQVRGLLFDNHGAGCLVVWNGNYDPYGDNEPAELELYLGETLTRTDLFGNSQSLASAAGATRLTLDHWPVLLTGINIPLARLQATMRLEPDFLEADILRQETELVFVNPWPDTIAGSIQVLTGQRGNSQRGWDVSPQSFNFVLRNGQELRQPLSVKFPSSELGGAKMLALRLTVNADRNYTILRKLPFEIRLNGIDVSTFAQRLGDNTMRVQQIITNETDQPLSLRSFMDMPNLEHQELPVTELPSGQTTTKIYLVPDIQQWYGKFLRIGLYDPEGTRRVNYQVPIK